MICRSDGSTFFTMFSSWWGSDVRLYTSTNACRRSQGRFSLKFGPQRPTWRTCAHLVVCELAVLQVCTLQSSDAGVCVVEGVFAYAVWEAFLEERKHHLVLQEIRRGWWEKASCIEEAFMLLQGTFLKKNNVLLVWRTLVHYKASFVQRKSSRFLYLSHNKLYRV